jgi:2-dehydro-3-deoxyphosphooctonate aldolase (KDO 8-P synthase)
MRVVKISNISVGKGHPVVLIAGPCVIESADLLITTGGRIKEMADQYGFPYILKSSFEKANRTAVNSYRGPGLAKGLEILENVRKTLEIPVLTDVHTPDQVEFASKVVDCLQIPAFLCRQTELIEAAARTNLPVNIKKGQFLAAESMQNAAQKALASGHGGVLLTERGTTFGYRDLVVDMRSLAVMADMDLPVIFDATHSVQKPGAVQTGGERRFVTTLASAAAATGVIDGIFLEVHPQPEKALSDAESQLALGQLESLLERLRVILDAVERLRQTGPESSE